MDKVLSFYRLKLTLAERAILRMHFSNANFFQSVLTSSELKFKSKLANIAGLQLAYMLGILVKCG